MKQLKMLGLAAMAAMALMAFAGAGTASANGVLCSTATNPCTSRWAVGTVLDFSVASGTSAILEDTSNNPLLTCTGGTFKGQVASNPGGATTARITNTTIDWNNCTFTTDTTKLGKLKVEAEDDNGNGWIYADEEIKVTINLSIFGDCEYGVSAGTKLGTLKEGIGTAAQFTVNAIAARVNSCLGPSTAKWTVSYVLTEPTSTTLFFSTS